MTSCPHPKPRRSLLHGYDVVCDDCGAIIGRVAMLGCAVLTPPQAEAVLAALPTPDSRLLREAQNALEGAATKAKLAEARAS